MTWYEWMIKQLTDRGLWPEEAMLVTKAYVLDGAGEPMAGRINDTIEGYSTQVLAVILLGLSATAVEWIDANKPRHFARPMFLLGS